MGGGRGKKTQRHPSSFLFQHTWECALPLVPAREAPEDLDPGPVKAGYCGQLSIEARNSPVMALLCALQIAGEEMHSTQRRLAPTRAFPRDLLPAERMG
jgi:hypothetical protein